MGSYKGQRNDRVSAGQYSANAGAGDIVIFLRSVDSCVHLCAGRINSWCAFKIKR